MDNPKKKIIIVDDELSFLNIFSTALEAHNFEVKGFPDSQEFLNNVASEKPDLILLDISMPGLDGFQVLEKLKSSFGRHLPKIMFLTNLGEAVAGTGIDEHFAKQIGAIGYIHKTDDLDIVIGKIKSAFQA